MHKRSCKYKSHYTPTQPPYTPPTQPPHTPPTHLRTPHLHNLPTPHLHNLPTPHPHNLPTPRPHKYLSTTNQKEKTVPKGNDPAEGCTHQCSQCACPSTHRQRAFGFSLLGAARRSRCTKRPLELTWTTSLVVTYCSALMQAPSVPSAQPREMVHITSRESGMKLQ